MCKTELSSLRDTVNELEADKASVQQELQRCQRLYEQQLDGNNELRRQLYTAKQTTAARTQSARSLVMFA